MTSVGEPTSGRSVAVKRSEPPFIRTVSEKP
jgi:hypothetical protein